MTSMREQDRITSIPPKTPRHGDWRFVSEMQMPDGCGPAMRWLHPTGILVLSAVDVAEPENKPEWHVSVSFRNGVATAEVMAQVRRDFEMQAAQEDNHGNGVVRHLWLAVADVDRREDCHCVNEVAPTVDGEREWRP